jgi:glyoxylase-like metal-dependent hydrolase (beta-lactamase superfamily II)
MRRLVRLVTVVAAALTAACGQPAGSIEAAREALRSNDMHGLVISGSGRWYQFGQSASAELGWPAFDVSSFTATIDYDAPAARVQMVRKQVVEPGRERPAPVEQRLDQYVNGNAAWNMATPAGGSAPAAQPQPAAVEERLMEVWTTPHGFLRAAAAATATSRPIDGGGSDVTFAMSGGHRFAGTINLQNEVTRVETWIDNPVLGDTPVVFTYSDYRDFGGVRFPGRIVRTQGGHPALEITVSGVKANPGDRFPVPTDVSSATTPPVVATAEPLAPGVFYIRGGSHHSVAIDQQDHIVVVEGPQNEARSLAVIAKVKETIPGKPIRYLVNTHHHFDHSGGLRTYVDEGATIVTHESNRAFYEKAWASPHALNPDQLSKSKKAATFETVGDSHVLTDGKRRIEIYRLIGNGHNDGFLAVYLPAEKILVQVDAWAPTAAGVPPPTPPSPFAVNLVDNIQRLKLDVRQIASLHGPRAAPLADLQSAVGR